MIRVVVWVWLLVPLCGCIDWEGLTRCFDGGCQGDDGGAGADGGGPAGDASADARPPCLGNQVANPGFEAGTATWAPLTPTSTIARVGGGHASDHAARVCGTVDEAYGIATGYQELPSAVVGDPLHLEAWIRVESPTEGLRLILRERSLGGLNETSTVLGIEAMAEWSLSDLIHVVAFDGASVKIDVDDSTRGEASRCFLVDDVCLGRAE